MSTQNHLTTLLESCQTLNSSFIKIGSNHVFIETIYQQLETFERKCNFTVKKIFSRRVSVSNIHPVQYKCNFKIHVIFIC